MPRSANLWERLRTYATTPPRGARARSKSLANHTGTETESENPWLVLHSAAAVSSSGGTPLPESSTSIEKNRRMPPLSAEESWSSRSPRWLSDASSPYGFSDEDASLKQTETGTWRHLAGPRGYEADRCNSAQSAAIRRTARSAPPGSTWFYQALAAGVLVAAGVYAMHNQTPLAADVRGVYQTAFEQDDSATLWSTVSAFAASHHIQLPSFLPGTGATVMHVPLSGAITVTQDYQANEPEMVLTGTPGEHVLAAGSGTVTRVQTTKSGTFITIDHGSIGTSWYTGVANPTVHVNEYVSAGEVIGSLPTQTKHPQLQFALEKNNQFENPHDFIHFPAPAKTGNSQ